MSAEVCSVIGRDELDVRKLGADEDKAAIKEKLAVIARQRPRDEPSDAVLLDAIHSGLATSEKQTEQAREAIKESREVMEQADKAMDGKKS